MHRDDKWCFPGVPQVGRSSGEVRIRTLFFLLWTLRWNIQVNVDFFLFVVFQEFQRFREDSIEGSSRDVSGSAHRKGAERERFRGNRFIPTEFNVWAECSRRFW